MTHKNNNVYRNQPQFETNPTLNNNLTPDVPKFTSNAMDNQDFIPLDSHANGCCKNKKAHKENSKDHKCKCDHK